jgi:hypothetical protein
MAAEENLASFCTILELLGSPISEWQPSLAINQSYG